MHNHVLAVLQGPDGLLLPEIGYQQVDLQPHLLPKMKGSRARATAAFPRMWEPPWKARPRAPRCVTGAAKDRGTKPPPTLVEIGRGPLVPFQLQHHSLDVAVFGVSRKPAQAFLRIAPTHDLDRLLTHAPAIHLTRRGHVEVNRVSS